MDRHEYLSSDFKKRYVRISTLRDTYDALVFAQKYDNAEAATLFIIIFAFGLDYFASAFTYFCAERSASYVSRSEDIRTYLF